MIVLAIEKLTLGYQKDPLFNQFSHAFTLGCHIIQGGNGVGKSTLLSAVSGSLPYKGRILVNGHELSENGVAARRSLGFVPDSTEFYPFVTGRQFAEFVFRAHKCGLAANQPRYEELIDRFNIRKYLNYSFSQMSLGTRKKFFIFTAMLLQPLLLVMDEPFNGLDDAASKELIELFDEYSRRSTILLTCHQPAIVECIKGIRWTLEEAPHAALTASQS
ncbi:hypothetical protein GCM10009425_44940 [Pseudomonas asuensis]|uniref:AAA+ ATPase domain-containing protein n=1 Tax=Pseudomonas asuensis TaxID=1825787 RepID=A0ABQ2H486_9PSED|nr:ABC transporter ATP-binding protein [Pseudomonas asuensis]GGM29389.1 hypothetical protein GCM10009425_44940 [Pseudomonas asuensis]